MNSKELACMPVWQKMDTIGLAEMKTIKLMNRTDTKFIAPMRLLPELLERAATDYRVQTTGSATTARYDTLYYDTPDREMYTLHHDGHLCRQKIRTRTYLDSNSLSFLEIKNKTNTGRTKKKRIAIPRAEFECFADDPAAQAFLSERSRYAPTDLRPAVRTEFDRITLADKALTERLTIDSFVRFENIATGNRADLGDAVIIELKRNSRLPSPMLRILDEMHIHAAKMSKYCIGTALTVPDVKMNRFKERIRIIEKITNNTLSCQS